MSAYSLYTFENHLPGSEGKKYYVGSSRKITPCSRELAWNWYLKSNPPGSIAL